VNPPSPLAAQWILRSAKAASPREVAEPVMGRWAGCSPPVPRLPIVFPAPPRGTRCIPGSPGTVAPVKHSPVACVKPRAGENSHRGSIVCAHTRLADGRHAIHLRHPHRYHLVKAVAGHDLNRLQRRQVVSSRSSARRSHSNGNPLSSTAVPAAVALKSPPGVVLVWSRRDARRAVLPRRIGS
jgi:hypothetical protein